VSKQDKKSALEIYWMEAQRKNVAESVPLHKKEKSSSFLFVQTSPLCFAKAQEDFAYLF